MNRKPMYGNYRVYHPEGHLMFYCDLKKINWYLDRNLAREISEEDKSIQLTFTPKGDGEDPRFLRGYRKNRCVISGVINNLTKHHVVPTQYRKLFPVEYKSRNSNDVVAIEDTLHNEYEIIADEYKKELIDIYITEDELNFNRLLSDINKIISTLCRHERDIPKERIDNLLNRLDYFLDILGINIDQVSELSEINYSKLIVDRMGIDRLIVSWKNHFIKHTKPKYLPSWWDPNFVKVIDIRDKK